MERQLYLEDHEIFRDSVKTFVKRHVSPNQEEWIDNGLVDKATWTLAGEQGLLGMLAPEEFGGSGTFDYRIRNVLIEELAAVGEGSLAAGFAVQEDIVIPYICHLGTEAQKRQWLPGLCSGELIGAIAMTEPGTGSDLRAMTTSAVRTDTGWNLTGAKTFISNGYQADLVIVAARTIAPDGSQKLSLFLVDSTSKGFARGRKLKKMGLMAQDTAELFFEDVALPEDSLLGEPHGGFDHLTANLPLERLSIAAQSAASACAALKWTTDYCLERQAFGKRIADFQNTRFVLAEIATEVEAVRHYVDRAILAWNDQQLTAVDAAKVKLLASETQNRVIDRCVQLFGGYGYMTEYPIARAYQDARVQTIFGGTNEIMKTIIAADLLPRI